MNSARIVGFLLAVSFPLTACSPSSPREPSNGENGRVPDQVLEGFTMIITDQGVKKSRFSALRASIFNKEERVESEDIKVEFFRSNGELYSTLWADSGVLDTETKDMDAYSNVVVVSHDDIRLETESLHWDQTADLITTDDRVTLIQEGKRLEGMGMESDPGLSDVKILQPTGVFRDTGVSDRE